MKNKVFEQKKVVIAREEYSDSAQSLIDAIQSLLVCVPADYDEACVDVEINPTYDSGKYVANTARLIEETLTDGSLVYNIEVYG